MLVYKYNLRNKAMTAVVQELLNTFDNLTYSERLDLLSHVTQKSKKVSGTAIPSKIAAKP